MIVKTFSATKSRERVGLGDVITEFLKDNPHLKLDEKVVVQSSDNEFHCLTIVCFFEELPTPVVAKPGKTRRTTKDN